MNSKTVEKVANLPGVRSLPQRVGGFSTLIEGLEYAARGNESYSFYSGRGALSHVLTFADLQSKSRTTARKLMNVGLNRGDRVGIVAETGADFMIVFFACQYAGLIPCPMPYSMYIGGKDAYVNRVAGMLRAANANAVVTSADLENQIREGGALVGVTRILTHDALQAVPESDADLQPFAADEVAYIQYSSGSTSEPKGVLITQKSIMANADGILRYGLAVNANDRAFSWLPLYHDMGLVGFCLSPMLAQVSVDFLATTAFARRPALWLKLMSERRTTISYSPTFGYDLAAKRINGDAASLDLSALRIAGIGGDMVRPDVLNTFAKTLDVAKFNARAFLPSYGMAESTLAVSFTSLNEPVRTDTVVRDAMKSKGIAVLADSKSDSTKTRSFVICGKPLPGHLMVVRGDSGEELPDRTIGRLFVNGPSLMAGYYNREEDTSSAIGADGYLDTGDMGYRLGDEFVITGRAKDLILHNGRNIWPQDIEWVVEKISPLKAGDVAAFAVETDTGEDDVVVLVQCRVTDPSEQEELRRAVSKAVHQSAGVDCTIVLVAPKSLPFTSSGKLSRAGARNKYLCDEIGEIGGPARAVAPEFLQAAQ